MQTNVKSVSRIHTHEGAPARAVDAVAQLRRTLKFQSFVRLDQAKVFCDIELRERRDCRMLQYDANKTPMDKVRQRMIAAETWDK